jgi:hypothetical protein
LDVVVGAGAARTARGGVVVDVVGGAAVWTTGGAVRRGEAPPPHDTHASAAMTPDTAAQRTPSG